MSRRPWKKIVAGLALAGGLAALFLWRAEPALPNSAHSSPRASRSLARPRLVPSGDVRDRPEAADRGAADASSPRPAPTDAELIAAATVIASPARFAAAAPPPAELPGGPLPPEVEGRRALALQQWKAEAIAAAEQCARGKDRHVVELQVMLEPAPRAPGAAEQLLHPAWVTTSPEALRALSPRHDPFELRGCLEQVRAVALSVALPGDALTQAFPSSIESFSVAL